MTARASTKKVRVYVDTNALYPSKNSNLNRYLSDGIVDFGGFLKAHKLSSVSICIPELVLEERIQQHVVKIGEVLADANESIGRLASVGYRKASIRAKKNHDRIVRKSIRDELGKHNIVIVGTPNFNKDQILQRAIKKIKPFNDSGAGFKDTIIYLSIVNDAENIADKNVHFILCTNNKKDFTDAVGLEFSQATGCQLRIVDNLGEAKEALDQLMPLNLELQKRNSDLKNLVGKNLGDIMVEINRLPSRKINHRHPWDTLKPHLTEGGVATHGASFWYDQLHELQHKKKPSYEAYNFKKFEVGDVSEVSNGKYQLSVSVDCLVQNDSDEDEGQREIHQSFIQKNWGIAGGLAKRFEVNVLCDLAGGTIRILSCDELPYSWISP